MRRIIVWFCSLFPKKKPIQSHIKDQIGKNFSGAGRKKNVIYPNDGDAVKHMNEHLDEVFWKHHG